ncbi:hypothetical protein HUK65_17305 [Rhodobacteraceae bacterium 2376]|uniref:Uncharacterized protein n=1 Tax=Rhabdonatronobacter sediminivivens TaxID=2743469 RepID=A0A7Z0L1B3_9RHOB|nr:hypothetical protein [Rhabdonatronobacter sediminivivens]NYS26736.1 hypothetical protein [Rhabdonatronobacter sediminivivens]
MVLGYVMTGMTTGALLAGMGLFAGSPLWVAVLLYSLGGTIGLAGCLVGKGVRKHHASPRSMFG